MLVRLIQTIFAVALATAAFSAASGGMGFMPNRATTPGAINPQVSQGTIFQTICVRGWTATIRPNENYTSELKREQLAAVGIRGHAKDFEEDHLIPLGLGGSPTDRRNLWPQPRFGYWNADKKDELEAVLSKMVCRGLIGLDAARSAIATNWVEAYHAYVERRSR